MDTLLRFITRIIKCFPSDPLATAIDNIPLLDMLGYVNYVLPVKEIIHITDAWLGAMILAKVGMFVYNMIMKKV